MPRCSSLLDHGQGVAGWILEPGDQRTALAEDAFVVGRHLGAGVGLEGDSLRRQFVDRLFDVVNRKVQGGVRGRAVARAGVHQRVAVTGELQSEHRRVAVLDAQPEGLAVEPLRGLRIVHREAAERLAVRQHADPFVDSEGQTRDRTGTHCSNVETSAAMSEAPPWQHPPTDVAPAITHDGATETSNEVFPLQVCVPLSHPWPEFGYATPGFPVTERATSKAGRTSLGLQQLTPVATTVPLSATTANASVNGWPARVVVASHE